MIRSIFGAPVLTRAVSTLRSSSRVGPAPLRGAKSELESLVSKLELLAVPRPDVLRRFAPSVPGAPFPRFALPPRKAQSASRAGRKRNQSHVLLGRRVGT